MGVIRIRPALDEPQASRTIAPMPPTSFAAAICMCCGLTSSEVTLYSVSVVRSYRDPAGRRTSRSVPARICKLDIAALIRTSDRAREASRFRRAGRRRLERPCPEPKPPPTREERQQWGRAGAAVARTRNETARTQRGRFAGSRPIAEPCPEVAEELVAAPLGGVPPARAVRAKWSPARSSLPCILDALPDAARRRWPTVATTP